MMMMSQETMKSEREEGTHDCRHSDLSWNGDVVYI